MLFTPSGERLWAREWDPTFPSPPAEETEPGTVFQIDHAGGRAIWTVARHEPGESIAYCMTVPGDRSGLVTVTCRPSERGTTATVTYDMTALSPAGNAGLGQFAKHYPEFLRHWSHSISQTLEGRHHR